MVVDGSVSKNEGKRAALWEDVGYSERRRRDAESSGDWESIHGYKPVDCRERGKRVSDDYAQPVAQPLISIYT
jgi:hypothetical protein